MQWPNIKPYLKRGALGGVIGVLSLIVIVGLLWTSIGIPEDISDLMKEGFPAFLLIARFPPILPMIFSVAFELIRGAINGAIIGFFIWLWATKIGKNPHPAARVLIGVGVPLALSGITLIVDFQSGRRLAVVTGLLYAVVIGILAGLLARSKSPTEASSEAESD
jgi:hypothetical protein